MKSSNPLKRKGQSARKINQTISKEAIRKAKSGSFAIAIEVDDGIRMRTTIRTHNRYFCNFWPFYRLMNRKTSIPREEMNCEVLMFRALIFIVRRLTFYTYYVCSG